jgi:hypothetical protein
MQSELQNNSRLHLLRLALIIIVTAFGVFTLATQNVGAQDPAEVTIVRSGAESQFPEGMTFFLDVESDVRIDDVRVVFTVGDRGTNTYSYLELEYVSEALTNGEFYHRTNSRDRYIPPGTTITFFFEITDETGYTHVTDPETFRFDDARYEWEEVILETVTILYHGPLRTRAERLAEAAVESLHLMADVTGADITKPITMTLYNNNAEMIGAVARRSLASSRELVTEGQAFESESLVLVLAGRSDIGTATHEMTHILVARASGGAGNVPLWLNEGLAEYGNLDQTVTYERFLEWAEGTDRLTPLKNLRSFPGDPNLTLVAYGQGRSAVEYMLEEFGNEKMRQLLAVLGGGVGIDGALQAVYGFGIDDLQNQWREYIGADPYVDPTPGPTPTPQPEPTPAYQLLTAPPTSGGSSSSETPTAEPLVVAPAETEVADHEETGSFDQGESEPNEDEPSSGTCSAPVSGAVDVATIGWALGALGLISGMRMRRSQ